MPSTPVLTPPSLLSGSFDTPAAHSPAPDNNSADSQSTPPLPDADKLAMSSSSDLPATCQALSISLPTQSLRTLVDIKPLLHVTSSSDSASSSSANNSPSSQMCHRATRKMRPASVTGQTRAKVSLSATKSSQWVVTLSPIMHLIVQDLSSFPVCYRRIVIIKMMQWILLCRHCLCPVCLRPVCLRPVYLCWVET